jgi:hypothetical protein
MALLYGTDVSSWFWEEGKRTNVVQEEEVMDSLELPIHRQYLLCTVPIT